MPRRPVGRSVVRAPKRPTFWEGATGVFVLTTGTVSTATIVSEATLENTPNPTLIRIHGHIFAHVTARGAAGDAAVLGIGMLPQSSAAVAAGVNSMPLPITDVSSPWLMHRQVVFDSNIAPPNGTDIGGNQHIMIDNKSMRKFDLNQALQIVVQNTVLAGTLSISIGYAFRFLFKR